MAAYSERIPSDGVEGPFLTHKSRKAMMGTIKDLTGQTFGRLTVVNLLQERTKDRKTQWRCRCSCGGWAPCVTGNDLTRGHTKSCGCLNSEKVSNRNRSRVVHGVSRRSGNDHYSRWAGIKQRTGNPNHDNYHNYGGRGITFHEPWAKDFATFKAWLDENLGPCPEGFSLDRIDNDGNYEPGNLRWASRKDQYLNQRVRP